MEYKAGETIIELIDGDITKQQVDAVVNAANSRLQMGGGVAGAIRKAGGEEIQRECDEIGGTPVGTAAITTGGSLPAKHVIHAVGPRQGEGEEESKLAGATVSSLKIADERGLKSIALPAISSGIYGVPMDFVARVMLRSAVDYLSSGSHSLKRVVFCLFGADALEEFRSALTEITAGS